MIRGCLVLLMFGSPAFGVSIAPAVATAFLANDGVRGAIVPWLTILLAGMELVWGIDFGTLSLAFLVTVLVVRAADHRLALTPLVRESTWRIVPVVRAVFIAIMATILMKGLSILVEAWVYHRGALLALAVSAYAPFGHVLAGIGLVTLIAVVLLHGGDVPFRRRISFGI